MLTCPNCGREGREDFSFCPACGTLLGVVAPAREVRKPVTVVFCDVTGSTALGERLDAESMRHVQSRYFGAMRGAIERHGGTVEKYIGDAVMAVFGIPQVHEDDALRAARAAMEMREAIPDLNNELQRDRGVAIEVRIGVNTGEVVAGDSAAKQAFVTGDTVNVAARLEQHAVPGEVLLGETTYRLVREAIEAEPAGPLVAKGKADPVPAWRLLGERDLTTVVSRLNSPIIGREHPLLQLRQAFEAVEADAAPRLVTILGTAGVGKSRVTEEFLGDLQTRATVLRGRCLPYGEGITYFPVVEAIKGATGLADFDLPDVIEAKVCSVLEGDEHQELVCHLVSELLGASEWAAGEETFWAIQRFFEALAGTRPLVLVFDDIHWGEPTFLDLVEHIAGRSRGLPILLLCVARPELLNVRPTWGEGKGSAARISLEALSDEQAVALIANLLGSGDLSAEAIERIVSTAEGNPLFIEQMLAMLIDDGLLVHEDDRWVAARDLSDVKMPPSIQVLLAARLDGLALSERTVLETAAVIGQEVSTSAVRDLVPEEIRPTVGSDLMALIRKELIRLDRPSGQDAFSFRHLLVRDAAYDSITKSRRAELHERFADRLEHIAGPAVIEQEEIVGYHLEQAHRYLAQLGPADDRSAVLAFRASTRLASAGRRASSRGDFVAGANLLRRALAVGTTGGAERAAMLYEFGNTLEWTGDVREALSVFSEAMELAATSDNRSLQWLARIRQSWMKTAVDPQSKPTKEVQAELEEAADVFEELEDQAALATVWTLLAELEWIPCRFERAERAARRAVEHARRSGDGRLLTDAITYLIAAQGFGTATPEQGLRTLDELAEAISRSRSLESFALVVRGFYRGIEGSLDEARRLIAESSEIAESLNLRFSMAARERLGYIELCAGNALAAEQAFRRNYEILDELGDEGHKTTSAASLASALCALGRFDEAEGYAVMARRAAPEDDLASQVTGRSAQAMVLAARGEFDEAERLAREAVQMYSKAEAPTYQGDVGMDLAKVLRMAGKLAEADQAAREALALYEHKGNRPASAATKAFIEELGLGVD